MSKLACFVLTLWLLAAAANASWQINFARIVSEKGPTGKRKSSLGTIQTRRILLQDGHGSQKRDHGYHPESKAGRFQDAFCASLRFKASRKTPQPRRIRNDLKMKILDHLLVVISFSWDIKKLVCLDRTLTEIRSYRTDVEVIVVSDFPTRVQKVLEKWDFGDMNVTAWTRRVSADLSADDNEYALLWHHRDVFMHALETGSHTAYLYLEDDTKFSWRALVSWACDTEALAPLGFQRGIYRTEISPNTGEFVLLDAVAPFNLSKPPFPIVHAPVTVCSPGAGVEEHQAHIDYVQLTNPFQGLWLATREQLVVFTKSSVWSKQGALDYSNATIAEKDISELPGIIIPWKEWGYPEKSNGLNILVDVPSGYMTNNVVPIRKTRGSPTEYVLSPSARVEHVRNGYSGLISMHGKIAEDGYFTV